MSNSASHLSSETEHEVGKEIFLVGANPKTSNSYLLKTDKYETSQQVVVRQLKCQLVYINLQKLTLFT